MSFIWFQIMKFFLSLTGEGRQTFMVHSGKCSGLMKGTQVVTHHSSFHSSYTDDPAIVVEVNRLPVNSMLSKPAITKMLYPEGDNAIRAELGWLDEEVSPEQAELAMVIGFKNASIKFHSFLVGGKARNVKVPLKKLDGGLCRTVDPNETLVLGVDFTMIQFPSMKKATEWRRIEEMFKDSLSNCGQFAKENVYARWRILEVLCVESGTQGSEIALHLEVLPLTEKLESMKAELLAKYNSTSNLAISLMEIPLMWRAPDVKKTLFTTPCLVMLDSLDCVITDSMVRLGMSTVRDVLRSGRSASGLEENKSTVYNPQVLPVWGRCSRELYMAESDTFSVVGKGKYDFSCYYSCVVQHSFI